MKAAPSDLRRKTQARLVKIAIHLAQPVDLVELNAAYRRRARSERKLHQVDNLSFIASGSVWETRNRKGLVVGSGHFKLS